MIKLPSLDLKKDDPKTMALMILSAVILFVVYFILLLQPQLGRLTGVLSTMGTLKSDVKSGGADIAKINQFKSNIEAYREKVEQYEKRLPVEHEIPSLLENLSAMAKSSNIKILGITPVAEALKDAKAQKDRVYQEMPILITAKSGYHELGQFLYNLENADRFMKVVDIDIKASRATPKKHDVEMVVSTFILLKSK